MPDITAESKIGFVVEKLFNFFNPKLVLKP